jgi:serine/threonine-protein kinase
LDTAQKKRASQGITNVEEKFALLDIIKEKSCGTVYLYEERVDHNLLVIKKLPSTNSGFIEARLLTSLKHNNIVNILGASKNEQLFIIAMEYLSGGSLNDRLINPRPWFEVLKTAREICDGLYFAHKNRIIHGNLRPSNILYTETGQAKVTDFGLDEHYGDGAVNWYNISGEPKSVYTDIFAAGVIFYQMLTGSLPEWKGTHLVTTDNFSLIPIEMQEIVSKMLVRKRGPLQGSFDQIITEIDLILETHKATAVPEPPTEILEDEAISAVSPTKPKSSAAWLFFYIFLPLVLLYTVVTAYLIYTGDIKSYTDSLHHTIERFSEFIVNFF